MSFFLLTLSAVAILADTPAGSAAPNTSALLASGEVPVTIVCLGDSVTGVYYHTGGRRAYPEMLGVALRNLYPKAKLTIVNSGISGDTTTGGLSRLERDVLRHKPQLVTIMFGLNDMVRVSIDDYRTNLTKAIEQCHKIGAEVVLCTPNGVLESSGRPVSKLQDYMAAMKQVGQEQKVPVVDVYAAYDKVRMKDALEFELLLSDEIHPNMDGHKLNAEEIAHAISGKAVSLAKEGPLPCEIPRVLSLLKEGKPVSVYAMPPYDELIGPALKQLNPKAEVKVTTWATSGKTMAELEAESKALVRPMKPDLVIISIPLTATSPSTTQYIRSFTWVMNWSLSFGHQEWDVIAVPPSVIHPKLGAEEQQRDALLRRLINAQHIGTFGRPANEESSAAELLTKWLQAQAAALKTAGQ